MASTAAAQAAARQQQTRAQAISLAGPTDEDKKQSDELHQVGKHLFFGLDPRKTRSAEEHTQVRTHTRRRVNAY